MDRLLTILYDTDDRGPFFRADPHEIEYIAIGCNLEKLHHIWVDGIIYNIADKVNAATDENFQKYMEYHYATCEDESIIGASVHGLWVGRKK
jgi:hypothetical protein